MLRLMLAVAATAACGTRPPSPAPAPGSTHTTVAPSDAAEPIAPASLDQDLPRLADRTLALYQDTAKLFAAVGEDCSAAASRLAELQATYRDAVAANAKVLHDGRAKELRAAIAPHSDAFDAAAKAIAQSPTMAKCSQDAAFEKAFDALFEVPP